MIPKVLVYFYVLQKIENIKEGKHGKVSIKKYCTKHKMKAISKNFQLQY